MSTMNLGQMQSAVKDIVGNIDSSSVFYKYIYPAAGLESQSVINIGINKIIRKALGPSLHNFDLFPELNNTWTIGPTISGTNRIAFPSDCIVVSEVMSAQAMGQGGGGTITAPGTWAATRENPVNYTSPSRFGVLTKDSTTTPGYARIWTRTGKSILINPTPSANFLDYLRFYGISKVLLVDATDTPYIHEDYHSAGVHMAAYELAVLKGWRDVASGMLDSVREELSSQHNMVTEVEAMRSIGVESNMPSRGSIYGEGF